MSLVPFTVYEKATGRVLRSGHCLPVDLLGQVGNADEALVPVRTDPEATVIVDGEAQTRPPDAAMLRESEASAVRDLVGAEIQDDFTLDGVRYPARLVDQVNLMQAAMVGGYLWRLNNGGWEFVSHTAAEAQAVLAAFAQHRDGKRQELNATLETIASASELQGVLAQD